MKFWFGKSKEEEATVTEEPAPTVTAESNTPAETPAESVPEPIVADDAQESEAKAEETSAPVKEPEPKAEEPKAEEPKAEEPKVEAPKVEAPAKAEPPAAPSRPAAPNPREFYYLLMNALYDAVLILDGSGHITDSNERVTPVLGYERGDLWDMPVEKIVKGVGPVIFNQMKTALHNNQQVLISARCARKDGSIFQGEVSACSMRLARGENFVLTVRNIEKRIAEIKAHLKTTSENTAAPGAAAPARRMVLKAVKRSDA